VTTTGRILLSQTPFRNPEHEPLPEFADRWFERWDRGGDVTRWYGAEIAHSRRLRVVRAGSLYKNE
jgi:hypothetical protein